MKKILIFCSILLFSFLKLSYGLEKIDGTPFFYKYKVSQFKKYKKIRPTLEELKLTHKVSDNKILSDIEGEQKKFWCYNFSTNKYYQITATCKLVGNYSYIYVENNRAVSTDILNKILSDFEKTTGIYNTCRAIFGREPNIDVDSRLTILLLDIKDNSAGNGYYISGYFSPVNEYPKSVEKYSNQREIIYIDISPGLLNINYLIATIAHEFQHMIHWNYDPLEEVWVDEGCSVFAEFICRYRPPADSGILLALKENPNNSLVIWEDKLQNYGITYLFILYIYEKYGGTNTIREIVQNEKVGIEGITEILQKKEVDFIIVFKNFIVANYLDEEEGIYGYETYNNSSGEYIKVNPTYTYSTYSLKSTKSPVNYFAANYYEFINPSPSNPSHFFFAFNGTDYKNFSVQYIVFNNTNREIRELTLDIKQDGNMGEENFQKIVIIPSLISPPQDTIGTYAYSLNDGTPPKIYNLNLKNLSEDSTVISWETDEACFSYIEYEKSGENYKLESSEPNNFHNFHLTNLIPDTLYNYWCTSKDTVGNTAITQSYFETLSLSKLKIKGFPNPCSKIITFDYSYSPLTTQVWIDVYNLSGKLIKKIPEESIDGKITWDFSNSLSNGVYLYRLNIIDNGKLFSKRNKFVVLK